MKNNKIRITLATVVALTLLVCAAFAISVSADETNEKIPQVISQNICYQGHNKARDIFQEHIYNWVYLKNQALPAYPLQ